MEKTPDQDQDRLPPISPGPLVSAHAAPPTLPAPAYMNSYNASSPSGAGAPAAVNALPLQPANGTSSHSNGSQSKLSSPNVVGVHYKVGRKIGEGSFGVIYEGVNLLNNSPVAIKFEPRKSDAPQLRDEYRTYKILQDSPGIPSAHYFGQEGLHNILCIDLLGPSLEDMFDLCGRKFSIKTTCMVAKQMITRLQTIHEHNLIYRDIKPDNFLIGRIPKPNELQPVNPDDPNGIVSNHLPTRPHPVSQIYIVDFGMAKQYRDPKTFQHIPYREKKSLSGTARYMSINTHLGREQSRRDDLEALGHVFMYFLRGSLPWQGLKAATNKQKYEKIGEKKQNVNIKDLCEGFPEFAEYLNYARTMKFDQEPDYDLCRGYMNKVLLKIGEQDDGVYDWMEIMDGQRKERERLREEFRSNESGPPSQTPQGRAGVGVSTTTVGFNSSVAGYHKASINPSQSMLMEGSQAISPSYQMSPVVRDVNTGRVDMQQRASGMVGVSSRQAEPHYGDSRRVDGQGRPLPSSGHPAAGQVRHKKKKWWQKLFSLCRGKGDTTSR